MRKNVLPFLALSLLTAVCVGAVYAQKAKPKPSPTLKTRPAIFSVIYGGSGIEPIAFVENGKLVAGGNDGSADGSTLSKLYYKPGAKYDLIFGGVSDGTVTVKKSNVGSECGGSSAEVTVASTKAKLKGFVMGLATNITPKGKATGLRRMPTAAERAEIESLVNQKTQELEKTTPPVITWQDWDWPCADGDYCMFLSYGSKALYNKLAEDKDGQSLFIDSVYHNLNDADADELWEDSMPAKLIKDNRDADGLSPLFYVFKSVSGDKIVTLWDMD